MKIVIQKLLNIYHLIISPWLGTRCRFAPSCSEYANQVYQEHDYICATKMTAKRVCRCHPWGGHGYDPVIKVAKITPIKPDSTD